MKKNNVTLITLGSVIAMLYASIQIVHADADLRNNELDSTQTKGNSWNAVDFNHGCSASGSNKQKDIIATSILFPIAGNFAEAKANILYSTLDSNAKTPIESPLTLTNASSLSTLVNFGGRALTPTLNIVAPNIFPNTIPLYVSGSGNIVGFQSFVGLPNGGAPIVESVADGMTAINITASAPLGFGQIQFPENSCLKKVVIRGAAAIWCEKDKASFTSGSRADFWINPERITDTFGTQKGVLDEETKAPTLTVTNAAYTSAPKDCSFDTLILESNSAMIKKYLPISSAKYPKGTSGVLYWPTVK